MKKAATKLNALALGYAAAIVAAAIMLLLGILGNLGIYTGAVDMIRQPAEPLPCHPTTLTPPMQWI